MEAYFDNSATTRCYPEVAQIVVKTMTEDFGNPSSMHLKGVEAEKYIRDTAGILAGLMYLLPVEQSQIIWHCLVEQMQISEVVTTLSPHLWSMLLWGSQLNAWKKWDMR